MPAVSDEKAKRRGRQPAQNLPASLSSILCCAKQAVTIAGANEHDLEAPRAVARRVHVSAPTSPASNSFDNCQGRWPKRP
jgi:hypothetical protein